MQTALDAFGGMDVLVNNAGILRDKTIFNMEESDWDAVLAVHLKGHYCCSRPFAKYIRDQNRTNCRIVNFSSTSGLFGNFGQANYGAAKAGIAGFTRVLALELAKYGCTVNTISPGALTRMTIPLREARGETVKRGGTRRRRSATHRAARRMARVGGRVRRVQPDPSCRARIDRHHAAAGHHQIVSEDESARGRWPNSTATCRMLIEARKTHDAAVKVAGKSVVID